MSPVDKSQLRARLRRDRRQVPPQERQAVEARTVAALDPLLADGAVALCAYMALGGELDLSGLIRREWARGRPVWLPRVRRSALGWHAVTDDDLLLPGAYGIPEPDATRCPEDPLPPRCLIVVPGIGFTAAGMRLGQGGGFYDRSLVDLGAGVRTVGVAFGCQLVDRLPEDPWDRPVDALLVDGDWVLSL